MLSTTRYTKRLSIVILLLTAFFASACGEEAAPNIRGVRRGGKVRPGMPSPEARKRLKEQGSGLIEGGEGAKGPGGLTLPQITETHFIAGTKHRDPFMPFVEVIGRQEEVTHTVQRKIKLKEYDIVDLRLIGIITNIGDPRAMVVTPEGTGFVLKRGDYVGKADYVDTGSGSEKIQVNWRVARIHGSTKEEERGVYLVRDDPTTSKGLDVTRFMPLHDRNQ